MRIVIDLGCKDYGGPDESTSRLLKRFRPHLYYGFDPELEGDVVRMLDSTICIFVRKAAWIYTGQVWFTSNGLRSGIEPYSKTTTEAVPCFRFSNFIDALPDTAEIVVKMDVEGAEYALLQDLHESGRDEKVSSVLVEWHDKERSHGLEAGIVVPELRCHVEEWA